MIYEINGHKFEFYETIDSLPISQFHLYSKYALVQSGIGDSLADIDTHLNRIMSFLRNDVKKASQEILNLRRNIYAILNEDDFRHKAILCLVKNVDGKKWTEWTDEGINTLYGMILSEPLRKMIEIEDKIKSRLDAELMQYFPEIFASSIEKNYNETLRQRALLQLSEIIDKEDHTEQIQALTDKIFWYYDPKNFEGNKSAEIEFDKQFEEMCLAISREFGGIVKNYTVMEFYSAQNMLIAQQKELKKMQKKK